MTSENPSVDHTPNEVAAGTSDMPSWLLKTWIVLAILIGNLFLTWMVYNLLAVPFTRDASYVVSVGWIVPWLVLFFVHPKTLRHWLIVIGGIAAFAVADRIAWVASKLLARSDPMQYSGFVTELFVQLIVAAALLGPVILIFVRMLRREGLMPKVGEAKSRS